MTYSTQSPIVTHLYPAAAQPFYKGNANCDYGTHVGTHVNDYGTHVQPELRKRGLSMVNTICQHNLSATPRSRHHNDNIVQFMGPMTLIDHLKGMIKEVHGMDPNYSECEDNEQYYAHPSWAMNPNYSELNEANEQRTSSPIDLEPDSTSP